MAEVPVTLSLIVVVAPVSSVAVVAFTEVLPAYKRMDNAAELLTLKLIAEISVALTPLGNLQVTTSIPLYLWVVENVATPFLIEAVPSFTLTFFFVREISVVPDEVVKTKSDNSNVGATLCA